MGLLHLLVEEGIFKKVPVVFLQYYYSLLYCVLQVKFCFLPKGHTHDQVEFQILPSLYGLQLRIVLLFSLPTVWSR